MRVNWGHCGLFSEAEESAVVVVFPLLPTTALEERLS